MRNIRIINIVVLIALLVAILTKGEFGQNDIGIVAVLSVSLLLYQTFMLLKMGYGLASFQTIFVVLSYLFNFSFFWLIAIDKSDFIFFPNWMYTDIPLKCKAAFYSLMCIQGVFTGLVWKPKTVIAPTASLALSDSEKASQRQVFTIGLVMLIIGIPFKLYYDYLNILNSIANGGYGGFGGVSGLIDDFQHFAIAGVITMIASGYKKKPFCYLLIGIVFVYFMFVMTASGDRRYYVTAIIGIMVALVGAYFNNSNSRKLSLKRIVRYAAIFILALFFLNLIAVIRYQRSSSLGSDMVAQSTLEQLFSFDGVWETLGEFGITINALVLAQNVVPTTIPFQYGLSYLYAILFILPIGPFVHIPNASIGRAITSYVDIPVGSSYVLDLYANFGQIAFIPAIILGIILSRFVNINTNNSAKKLALSSSITYILINYVRSSTIEVLRPAVYILIMYYLAEFIIKKKR